MKRAISLFLCFLVMAFFIGLDAYLLKSAIQTDIKWQTIVLSMAFTVLLSVTFFMVWLLQELHKHVMKDEK